MKIKTPLFNIKIDILFIVVMFIFFLSIKLRDFFSSFFICYMFIIFHEASHMLIGTILGKSIDTFNIGLFGVSITFCKKRYEIKKNTNKKENLREILIYIAGPLSNFILAIIFKNIRIIFDINIFLGILNLIPVYPLDGYNILKNLLLIKSREDNVEKVINLLNYVFFTFLLIIGVICLVLIYNPSLILFFIYLIIIKNTNINSRNKTKYYK
jgi:stage IV sporulation protein FB